MAATANSLRALPHRGLPAGTSFLLRSSLPFWWTCGSLAVFATSEEAQQLYMQASGSSNAR
jgi:hypothetical protein